MLGVTSSTIGIASIITHGAPMTEAIEPGVLVPATVAPISSRLPARKRLHRRPAFASVVEETSLGWLVAVPPCAAAHVMRCGRTKVPGRCHVAEIACEGLRFRTVQFGRESRYPSRFRCGSAVVAAAGLARFG